MADRVVEAAVAVHRRELPALLYVRPLAPPFGESPVSFPITHPYVERCWLPLIGPSGTWCLRRLSAELAAHPEGAAIEVATLARDLGLSDRLGGAGRLERTIGRLCDFGVARFGEHDTLEVCTALPPIGPRALARLSREARQAHREMVAEAENPFLSAALAYARRGLPVLPLRVEEKVPDGRLVPHGLTEATTDEARIRSWWTASPRANVGIRTGGGIDVVDLDSPAALLALESLAREPLRPTVVVRTARGWHLWFASCGLPTRAGVLEGVDVRGRGGYVVAPPSRHPDGQDYAFLDERSGELAPHLPDAPLTPAPRWLIDRLRPAPRPAPLATEPIRLKSSHYVQVAVESECRAVATTPEGSRNHRLNRAAFSLGTLVGAKVLDFEDARAHLLDAALRAGLEAPEAGRTIASGLTAGERKPRRGGEELARRNAPRREQQRAVGADRERRSPDPSLRPGEAATDAVLARARTAPARTGAVQSASRSMTRRATAGARTMSPAQGSSRGDDRLAAAHEQLTRAVEQLVSGEDWARMLAVAARFHRYSLNNVLLIGLQMPEATRVAGYHTWQALGRQVRRGEHGLTILAPVLRRVPEDAAAERPRETVFEEGGDKEAAARRQLVAFKVAKVFDISATDGPPLPDVVPELLGGDAPTALYAGLAAQVEGCGFALRREDCSGANGRTDFRARTVTVRPDCSEAQAAKTLAHELCHVRLHDPKDRGFGDFACRGLKEVEAESVAYLVCQAAGLPTDEYSFAYVARWADGDVALVRSAAERSLSAARAITTSLGLTPPAPEPATDAVLARARHNGATRPAPLSPTPTRSPERRGIDR